MFEFLHEDWPHERVDLTTRTTMSKTRKKPDRITSNPMLPQTFSGSFDQYSTNRVDVSVTDDGKKKGKTFK